VKLSLNPNENQQLNNVRRSNLTWTGNKVDAIETVYALHASGVFNDGKADIKDVAQEFQIAFNIDLGDYYRAFLEIKSRKTVIPKFLTFVTVKLLAFIKDSEK
jgi:hypothetical protein